MWQSLAEWIEDKLGMREHMAQFGVHHYHHDDPLPPTFVANDPDSTRAICYEAFGALRVKRRLRRSKPWLSRDDAMFLADVATQHLWAGGTINTSSGNVHHQGEEL